MTRAEWLEGFVLGHSGFRSEDELAKTGVKRVLHNVFYRKTVRIGVRIAPQYYEDYWFVDPVEMGKMTRLDTFSGC